MRYRTHIANMPVSRQQFFQNFCPESFAILCDATELRFRIGRSVTIECGIIWAIARCIENGEGECAALNRLNSSNVEKEYTRWFRPNPTDMSESELEDEQMYNAPAFLPYRSLADAIEWKKSVTVAKLVATVVRQFEFDSVAAAPLASHGIDERNCYEQLMRPNAFIGTASLRARGDHIGMTIYKIATDLASSVGSWLVTRPMVTFARQLAQHEAGEATPLSEEWDEIVRRAKRHVSIPGTCKFLMSFPGPRPWSHRTLDCWSKV